MSLSLSDIEVPAGCPLTRCEWRAIELLATGLTYGQIAERVGCKPSTIRTHLHTAYKRLDVHNSFQAIAVVWSAGWLESMDMGWVDERITPGQHLYLEAFDRLLRAKRKNDAVQARQDMKHHLKSMCIERKIPVPAGNGFLSRVRHRIPGVVLPHIEVA